MRSTTTYYARDGRVYARTPTGEREVATALSSSGRDLARFERALNIARDQRETARPDYVNRDALSSATDGELLAIFGEDGPAAVTRAAGLELERRGYEYAAPGDWSKTHDAAPREP